MDASGAIDSIEACMAAERTLRELLNGGDSRKAIEVADQLVPSYDQEGNVDQLRALVYVEGGDQLNDSQLVERGAHIFRQLVEQDTSPNLLYSLASANHRIWNLAVKQNGFECAWHDSYENLRVARNLFKEISSDGSAPKEVRLKALTDAGNTYDEVGRYLDALEMYECALSIDQSFAMALGNRGMALFNISLLMGSYANDFQIEAADCLDAALKDHFGLLEHGGQVAVNRFRDLRSTILVSKNEKGILPDSPASFADPYLAWCLRKELFLHVSPNHIRNDTEVLDAISFKSFTLPSSEESLLFANALIDAFNTLKQDYMCARYLLWLATANESPISEHARAISKRVSFFDTASYARFSARTGLVAQAHKAAVDLMDKITAFVHIYLQSKPARGQVTFDKFPSLSNGKLPPYFASALEPPERNQGLMALLDIYKESKADPHSPLTRRTIRRHSSTHMFLVVHHMAAGDSIPKIDRVNWDQLIEESLDQLSFVRGAIFYLANTIEVHEEVSSRGSQAGLLPVGRADPELMDIE